MAPVMTASLAASAAHGFVDIDVPEWAWLVLVLAISALLVGDLLVVHRRPHVISLREAAIESAAWIAVGLGFAALLAWASGSAAAGEYVSGYLIEKSLSIENVFVWAVIFTALGVPARYRFRVLFWGVFGALVLRAGFIFAGVRLLETFNWTVYLFGAILLVTAMKLARHGGGAVDPERNRVLAVVRRVVPSTPDYDGQKLFTRRSGAMLATPLFAVLVLIETTDVLFAVDSIPAVLAVVREPFIVFASNAFAILGLRALYFCLEGMVGRFRYLNTGLAVIVALVGVKMLAFEFAHVPPFVTPTVLAAVLGVAVIASLAADRRDVRRLERGATAERPLTAVGTRLEQAMPVERTSEPPQVA
jgi:tellurite resistance protein TerC